MAEKIKQTWDDIFDRCHAIADRRAAAGKVVTPRYAEDGEPPRVTLYDDEGGDDMTFAVEAYRDVPYLLALIASLCERIDEEVNRSARRRSAWLSARRRSQGQAAELTRVRAQIAEAREVLADYAAHAADGHGIDPRTAAWIRDGLLDILGEPDGAT